MGLWASEEESDIRYSYAVNKILFKGKSTYQNIEVVETVLFGKMMLLDGLVMITEVDEFVYHELITHVPMCLHKSPKNILVVGGGDGGTIRELIKYPQVEQITMCEIDQMVVDCSKKFFPEISSGFNDPRVKVLIGDGIEYVKTLKGSFDLVIVDSTDPIGPGVGLFSQSFYAAVARALKKDGIMVAQTESPWHDKSIILNIHKNIKTSFTHVAPYLGAVPTYPRGLWSWTLASDSEIIPEKYHHLRFSQIKSDLKYLNNGLMTSCFILPNFFQEKLREVLS